MPNWSSCKPMGSSKPGAAQQGRSAHSGLLEIEPTLSPLFAMYIRNYLLDSNVEPGAVFEECGLTLSMDGEAGRPLPVAKVAHLLDAAGRHTDNAFVGMRMGAQYHYESPGVLISTILCAPSVEEAIRTLSYYDRFVDSAIHTSFSVEGDSALFTTTIAETPGVDLTQLNEYLMVFIVNTLNKATRKFVPLTQVGFAHTRRTSIAPLEHFFKVTPRFSCTQNHIRFDATYLEEPLFSSNKLLYEILINAMKTYFSTSSEKFNLISAVGREIIRETGPGPGSPTIKQVANNMALSPRTLRRRLADEGYSFQQVKNMAREQRAKYCLRRTNLPLSAIAVELGYSELSAFSRAFRLWSGESPQHYRARTTVQP